MKAFIRVAVLGAVLTIFGISQSSAQVKIGVVKSETIISSMPEFEAAQKQIEALQKTYLDTLQAARQSFDQQVQQYQQQQGIMDQAAKKQQEEKLTQLQQNIQSYQQAHLGPQGTVAQRQAELLQPIRDRVFQAIEVVAKREKIDAVMEKGEGGFLYVDSKLDITFKVLDYIQNSGG